MSERIIYPWVTFRLLEQNFCISSEYIRIMKTDSKAYELPGGERWLMGVADQNGEMIPVIDLRVVLGMASKEDELQTFEQMKLAHLNWEETLEQSVETGEPFLLADDPHECAFGKWYYNYAPEAYEVDAVYRKIEDPHAALHNCAKQVRSLDPEQAHEVLERAQELCRQSILPLLDDLVQAFRTSANGITIVLEKDGKRRGAYVDKVTAICPAQDMQDITGERGLGGGQYVQRVLKNARDEVFLEINIDSLMAL